MAVRGVVLAGAWVAAMAVCTASDALAVASDTNGTPDPEVAAAIQSLRGHSGANLSPDEYGPLGKKLDAAWKVLHEHPDAARKAIREVLTTEREDSFLIIDLAHYLTIMEDDQTSLELAAKALGHADVRVHPAGTFHALANMASLDCGPCLPAMIRILELQDPSTFIAEHALTIDAELGILFTLGQYGDDAISGVEAALASPDCVVRTNAARALMFLLPDRVPEKLGAMPLGDSCPEARAMAWRTLGVLDDPGLVVQARKRRAADPPPERDERLAMVDGLGSTFSPAARSVLELMSADPDAEVAAQATKAAKTLEEVEGRITRLTARTRGDTPPAGHAKTVRALEKGSREGRYEVEDVMRDLVPRLTPDDIPLLNKVRAAVLNRLSDECLYEYYPLTYAVRVLRRLHGAAEPVAAGAVTR
jgi:hypothetical protein